MAYTGPSLPKARTYFVDFVFAGGCLGNPLRGFRVVWGQRRGGAFLGPGKKVRTTMDL